MIKKQYIAMRVLAGVLVCAKAFSGPASTDYVKEAVNALRNELAYQFNSRFDGLNSLTNQLADKTNGLTATSNQQAFAINQLTIRLNALITQTNDADTTIHGKIDAVQNQVNELPIITHHIGEIFQGGMIFYVDGSLQHGLMASLDDLNKPEGVEWRNGEGGDRIINAGAQGLGAGDTNTRLIIAEQTIDQQEGEFAALLAANYQIAADGKSPCRIPVRLNAPCYSGWYLPSAYELMLLHANREGLNQLGEGFYWSSTEASTTEAWLVDFKSGQARIAEKSTLAGVRAIHSF